MCRDCGGNGICEHDQCKYQCAICDPIGHLRKAVSSRVRNALVRNKMKRSIEYLGCELKVFKDHIERQFKPDMTWENHGTLWHIDHIVPIKYDNPTLDDVVERLHYTNTQPLYASVNMAKGNRYIG